MNLFAVNIGEAFKLGNQGIKDKPGYGSIGEFVSKILPNVYIISGLILFALLLGGGFAIMTSGGDPEKKKNGSQAITGALIGFIIIFVSYWIIQIIEYITGVPILNPNL